MNVIGEISPVKLNKDPAFRELRKQMENNMTLQEQYKQLRVEYDQARRQAIVAGEARKQGIIDKYNAQKVRAEAAAATISATNTSKFTSGDYQTNISLRSPAVEQPARPQSAKHSFQPKKKKPSKLDKYERYIGQDGTQKMMNSKLMGELDQMEQTMQQIMESRLGQGKPRLGFEKWYERDGPLSPYVLEPQDPWYTGEFYEEMTEFYRAPLKSLNPTMRNIEVLNKAHDYKMKLADMGENTEYDTTFAALKVK